MVRNKPASVSRPISLGVSAGISQCMYAFLGRDYCYAHRELTYVNTLSDLIADWIWIVVIKLQELVSFQGSKYTGCLGVFGIPGVSCIADRVLYTGRVAAL